MRPFLFIAFLFTAFSCEKETQDQPPPSPPKTEYEIYFRELKDKSSWVMNAGTLVFDKTDVLLLDTITNTGFEFRDTGSVSRMPQIIQKHMSMVEEHPGINYLKDKGYIKLVRKQIENDEKYLVASNDSSFIFIYKVVEDSTIYSFSCEFYGAHCSDSTKAHYGFQSAGGKVFTFQKYP